MEGPHEGFFLFSVVVVAEEVEDAVDDKEGDFSLVGVSGCRRPAGGLGGGR